MSIPKGAIVGVTGKSGSGKSTLCRLFMRFWDVDAGRIAISDADVREIETACLRDNEAFVEQDTYLFHDGIRDNLDSLNEAAVLRSLDAQRGKRTVLLISHRASTMGIADVTVSMNDGRAS